MPDNNGNVYDTNEPNTNNIGGDLGSLFDNDPPNTPEDEPLPLFDNEPPTPVHDVPVPMFDNDPPTPSIGDLGRLYEVPPRRNSSDLGRMSGY